MKIPFEVKYRVEHRNGSVQQSTFVVHATKASEARLLAREIIRQRVGEDAAWVSAQPEGGAR